MNMSRIVDLSKTIENRNKKDHPIIRIKIKHKAHAKSRWIVRIIGGLPFRLFPSNFIGWADDTIEKMGVHSTTHIDAPWHYSPLCEGKPAKTIDEVPLEWCYNNGIVIDMSHKADFDPITILDIQSFLDENKLVIVPNMIVLIKTGRDKYTGKDFLFKGTGMSAAATEWLVDQGIKVMGIDQWGWDLPLKYMASKAKKDNDKNLFWEGHLVGAKKEYIHIEQLTNLDLLPYSGFKIAVFPLKIKGGSAAPARVVAIFD
ncbi:cyclase [Flavobacterium oncorhynchi]|uniref:Cyclase n=2 Tax=Flavobacterium oncorhynchi TaxID=728056 RepID=A0A226HP10_9FLAO|nr:cyclase [Flavobacterium oncorhynchi]